MDFGIQSISFLLKLMLGGIPCSSADCSVTLGSASTVKSSTLNPRALSKSERLIISTLHLAPSKLLATIIGP